MTSTETSGSIITWEPIRLSHIRPSFTKEEAALAGRQDVWHKFILFNIGGFMTKEILNAVISACDPEIVLPVAYKVEGPGRSSFLVKCTASAIENLVKQDLKVSLNATHEIKLDIILGFLGVQELQLNPNRIIAQALYNRYEPTKKVLNLDDFENEKILGSIFCPLSMPRMLHFVLRCTRMGILGMNRDSRLPIRELSLKSNNITAIILFEKFFNYHLTKLDIRYNDICDIEYLHYFSEFKISELWLDGNPLCAKYTDCQEYVQAVKSVFPYLQRLDGIVIGMEHKFVPSVQTNFLGDGSKLGVIKQFIRHYFTLYDQDDRSIMNGLYDSDAFYSMTLGPMNNYAHKQITKSFSTNRNLLKFVDYAKCQEFLLRGPEKILNALRRQPPTIHNFKSFHVDLLHQGERHIAFSVQGLFVYREQTCPPMLFSRTFVVIEKEDSEYCIINDQYYLDSTTSNADFKFDCKALPQYTPTMFSTSEKEQLLIFLRELTTMNLEFCRKFLQEAKWNIRNAITTFLKMYTVNDIPPEAFSQRNSTTMEMLGTRNHTSRFKKH